MLTITVPPELVGPLTAEAARLGTTPEQLVIEGVRRVLPAPAELPPKTLRDFLAGYVGTVEGSEEPFSEDCGRKFADGLAEGRPARP